MQHALVTIEQSAPADGVNLKAPEALKTGHINVGAELVELFADETGDASKVKKLQVMAQTITCSEFSAGVKQAKELADTIDSANGFKRPEAKGLKPNEYYGPKRLLLNSRMSEAKRIFGVAKQAPDILKEKGYWPALAAARQWLESNQRTWDGNIAEDATKRAEKRAQKLNAETTAEILSQYPMLMGETRADYHERTDKLIDAALEKAQQDAAQKRVEKIIASIRKQFGDDPQTMYDACLSIVESMEAIEETATNEESTSN